MTNTASTTSTQFITGEFPFQTIDFDNGEIYWPTASAAIAAGYSPSQVWSVACSDHDAGSTFTYGPSHHTINVIGFVVTEEQHDGDTYYEEDCEIDSEEELED